MHRIRIAQIGTGHDHAHYTMESMRRLADDFEVVGIYEPTAEYLEKSRTWAAFEGIPHYDSLEELLAIEDLEAVAIECDELSADKFSIPVLERGLALHLDKPGGYDPEIFRRALTMAKERSIPLQMGYMYRYNPMVKKILSLVREGKLGRVFSVETHMSVRHPKEKRQWLSSFEGGMMYFLGCHLLDLTLLIQGFPEKITAYNRNTAIEGQKPAEDLGFAVLEYENGLSTIKTCAAEVNGFERRQLVVTAENATIEVKPLESKAPNSDSLMVSHARITWHGEDVDPWRDASEKLESDVYDRYDPMMHDFAQIVRGEKQNDYTYDYEIALFEAHLACCGRV